MRLVVAVLLLLTCAAPSHAATSIENHGDVLFSTNGDEPTDVTATWSADGLAISDAGNAIKDVAGSCQRTGPQSVFCAGAKSVNFQLGLGGEGGPTRRVRLTTAPGFVAGRVQVGSGGGDDDIDLSRATVDLATVYAGYGRDRIAGPVVEQFAELSGDYNNDLVLAGGGRGVTNFRSVEPDGADTYVAGPGRDVMDYSLRQGVRVTPGEGHDDGAPGEGDDVGDVEEVRTWIGDDYVRLRSVAGGPLDGGPLGDDTLIGGPGDDLIDPGNGGDEEYSDADVLRGGPGRDTVSYANRTYPPAVYEAVRITQDGRANDGFRGEHDNIGDDVEMLIGTRNDDRISGGPAANTLVGGQGQDVLRARGGGRDEIDCGGGYDLAVVDRRDLVDTSCEVVKTG